MSGAGSLVNVAATRVGTRALGPGLRSVVWVQGCPFTCRGCMSPDWIPDRPARLVAPGELAAELLADARVTGLTLSGGEPMAQAAALAETVARARAERDLSVLCFTGYRLERLRRDPPDPGVARLLACVDVLVDGQYVAELNDGRGLRGSRNQRVHRLNSWAGEEEYDFEDRPRSAEIALEGPSALLVGVPPPGLLDAFDAAVDAVRTRLSRNAMEGNGT
ncbi:anaerobic ribonucleoside-triphosphate reductase activating protein [Kitasatospora sp. GAS204A]|uniref:4Fe-4S single cluster domain-containing protein n=1 Tax=unclassified Kitasatospora TaxID=2633591 RepID=UPI002475A42C|nr:4Fe-4S single cluster domain-containing protein [Kitasatospora sp. GAS204B]MDH6120816.1 anaerobic ribonucleoside-triphosphate reductase activating protein [Kitasatospora sp. GAS204B]